MLTLERTNQFKRDYKRESKGQYRSVLEPAFLEILNELVSERSLAESYRDHALSHNWKDHRDCHIKPDLILIYRKPNDETLQLVRLGSHSELGL